MTRVWAVWCLLVAGSFLYLEFRALADKTPGTVTLSEFGWHLMRNDAVNIAIIAFLAWLLIHFGWKGRIL